VIDSDAGVPAGGVYDSWHANGHCRQDQRAELRLGNLLRRDEMFTSRLEREVKDEGLPIINVGSVMSVDDLASSVADLFGL
jgi:hypothetical protein